MPFIEEIATVNPAFCHKQEDILHFMQSVAPASEHRKLKMIYQKSGIQTRYSVLADYSKSPQQYHFYPNNPDLEPFPNVEKRMQIFKKEALHLALQAVKHLDVTDITHLITVSCTGLSAPGLEIDLIRELRLPTHLVRTSVNFMGCYAGFHALRLADAFCKSQPNAKVLVVDIELCTLHFQKTPNEDNFLANALFADGGAAVLVSNDASKASYELLQFNSQLVLEGEQSMAWEISPSGFLMTLSSYVPQLLAKNIETLFYKVIENANYQFSDIDFWAIHPGGRRILESIEQNLTLKSSQVAASYEVLRRYGNMSSATIFFVLKALKSSIKPDNTIFACGFGPGLTMESLILRAL
jgi:predicted naringenin-chalcone synthase